MLVMYYIILINGEHFVINVRLLILPPGRDWMDIVLFPKEILQLIFANISNIDDVLQVSFDDSEIERIVNRKLANLLVLRSICKRYDQY